MVQFAKFTTGGFVLHKIPCGTGKLSVWYDAGGNLLDMEKFDKNGRKTGQGLGPAADIARRYGAIYAGAR